jgi:hypothetical protein
MIRCLGSVAIASLVFFGCSGQQPIAKPSVPVDEGMDDIESAYLATVPERYRLLYEPGLDEDDRTKLRQLLPFESISLSRDGCFGDCPVYSVTFHRTGNAEFEATAYLPELGKFTGKIDLKTYGRLCYLIDHSRFQDMKPRFSSNWTDDSTCVVAITQGEKRTEVSDYGSVGPIELWAIQELIDATRGDIAWTPAP